jgi:hypothetical protein
VIPLSCFEGNLVAGALHTLTAAVGTSGELDEKFEAPTLWGTTTFMSEELAKLGRDVLTLELTLEPVRVEVEWLKEASNASMKRGEVTEEKMVKLISMLMGRINGLAPELQEIRGRVALLEEVESVRQRGGEPKRARTSEESRGFPMSGRDGTAHTMDDMIRAWSGEVANTTSTSPSARHPTTDSLHQFRDESEAERPFSRGDSDTSSRMVGIDGNTLRQLLSDVALLKACSRDKEAVKFGNLGLKSIQDCQMWIRKNFSCHRYGLIMDPLLMLDRICGNDDAVNKANQFKTWESQIKLKISTGAEAGPFGLRSSRLLYVHRQTVQNSSTRMSLHGNHLGPSY